MEQARQCAPGRSFADAACVLKIQHGTRWLQRCYVWHVSTTTDAESWGRNYLLVSLWVVLNTALAERNSAMRQRCPACLPRVKHMDARWLRRMSCRGVVDSDFTLRLYSLCRHPELNDAHKVRSAGH